MALCTCVSSASGLLTSLTCLRYFSCIYRVEQRTCHASVLSAAATLRAAHRRACDQDSLKRRISAKGRIGDRCRAAVARGSFVGGVCASRVQAWVRRSAARQVYIRTVYPTGSGFRVQGLGVASWFRISLHQNGQSYAPPLPLIPLSATTRS